MRDRERDYEEPAVESLKQPQPTAENCQGIPPIKAIGQRIVPSRFALRPGKDPKYTCPTPNHNPRELASAV